MSNVVLPYTLQNGPTHPNDADQVMANFNAILAAVNGGLDIANVATALANTFLKLDSAGDYKVKMLSGVSSAQSFGSTNRCNSEFAHGLGRSPQFAAILGPYVDTSGTVETACPLVIGHTTWDATKVMAKLAIMNGGVSANFPVANLLVIG